MTVIDTDLLAEEKRRGLFIDLGFAYAPLPDGLVLGFVEVPGHERFIPNMLAGVIDIDYALLVVADDEGPMPQTRKHLVILDLLGVSEGAALWKRTTPILAGRGAQPPQPYELARALGVGAGEVEKFLIRAANLDLDFKVAANRFFFAESMAAEAMNGQFTELAFRDRSGIGRNLTVVVLEFFDNSGVTTRLGDARRIASNRTRFGIGLRQP